MGAKQSTTVKTKVRKMSATFMRLGGSGAVPPPADFDVEDERRGRNGKGKSKSRKSAAKGRSELSLVPSVNSMDAPITSHRPKSLDPRQEELLGVVNDKRADPTDVMRARIQSRRFDLNLHLNEEEEEDDEDEDDELFGPRYA
mmetsp:Transcript_6763/g.12503  ORF Transcript_6763/g.12503 Transcript_6763/m.12503 type:complete len:143 (+) Transcript_6763:310-738(+)